MSRTAAVTDRAGLAAALDGTASVARWAEEAARRHGVSYAATPADLFAEAVSRLSDAEAHLDATERLLLALRRAGVVTGRQGVLLHAAHLRQRA